MALDQLHQRTYGVEDDEHASVDVVLYSADSHVIEPANLWKDNLPTRFRDGAPDFGGSRPDDVKHGGGTNRYERLQAMDDDGVSIEILYATWGLKLLALDDPELEAACVRVYNDWLIDFCAADPTRLIGLALLSCYDIDGAIAEMSRCRDAGMRGISVWQIPRADLRFNTDHYDRLWAAAQEMEMPVSLHILSGHCYRKHPEMMPTSTDMTKKLAVCMDSIHDIIYSGVLERFPRRLLAWWGQDNCMWSNDFPHSNSTWPVSREIVARDLSHLPPDALAKVAHRNCAELYGLPVP
jgi:predicted TIM-barrel fold metal-dependent hydrolase